METEHEMEIEQTETQVQQETETKQETETQPRQEIEQETETDIEQELETDMETETKQETETDIETQPQQEMQQEYDTEIEETKQVSDIPFEVELAELDVVDADKRTLNSGVQDPDAVAAAKYYLSIRGDIVQRRDEFERNLPVLKMIINNSTNDDMAQSFIMRNGAKGASASTIGNFKRALKAAYKNKYAKNEETQP